MKACGDPATSAGIRGRRRARSCVARSSPRAGGPSSLVWPEEDFRRCPRPENMSLTHGLCGPWRTLAAGGRARDLRRLQLACAASTVAEWAYGIAVSVWAYHMGGVG